MSNNKKCDKMKLEIRDGRKNPKFTSLECRNKKKTTLKCLHERLKMIVVDGNW